MDQATRPEYARASDEEYSDNEVPTTSTPAPANYEGQVLPSASSSCVEIAQRPKDENVEGKKIRKNIIF